MRKPFLVLCLAVTSSFCSFSQTAPAAAKKGPSVPGKPVKYFDGVYSGLAISLQNIFGGSWVDGRDILAEDYRLVTEIPLGFRKQFSRHSLVAGAELVLGIANGNLSYQSPSENLFISYRNNVQWNIGLMLGAVPGRKKRTIFYVFANETKRKFRVTITDAFGPYRQTDKQGMLKFGTGMETVLYGKMQLRFSAGRLRADFGDRPVNISPGKKTEWLLGLNVRL